MLQPKFIIFYHSCLIMVTFNRTCNTILDRVYKEIIVNTNIRNRTLKKLIKETCSKTAFTTIKKLYQQIGGISIGSSLGQLLANIIIFSLRTNTATTMQPFLARKCYFAHASAESPSFAKFPVFIPNAKNGIAMLTRTQLNHLVNLGKWSSVRLQTKRLWVRVQLQSLEVSKVCCFYPFSYHFNMNHHKLAEFLSFFYMRKTQFFLSFQSLRSIHKLHNLTHLVTTNLIIFFFY